MKKLIVILIFAVALQAVSLFRVGNSFYYDPAPPPCNQNLGPPGNLANWCYPSGKEYVVSERGFPAYYNRGEGLYPVKSAASFLLWLAISAAGITTISYFIKLLRRDQK